MYRNLGIELLELAGIGKSSVGLANTLPAQFLLLLKTRCGALNWLDHPVFEKLNMFILIMCLDIYNFAPLKTTPKFKAKFSSFWAQYSRLLGY